MQHCGPVAWNWCTGAAHKHASGKVSYAKVQFHTHAHICPSMLTCTSTHTFSLLDRERPSPAPYSFSNSAPLLISIRSLHQLVPYSPNNIFKLRCSRLPKRLHFRSGLTLVLHMHLKKKIDSPTSLPPPVTLSHTHTLTHTPLAVPSLNTSTVPQPQPPLPKPMLTRSALCWEDSEVPCNLLLEELLSTAQSPVLGFPLEKDPLAANTVQSSEYFNSF